MPFSTSRANEILNYTFGKVSSITVPSNVYIGLSTNDPEASDGTFNELSGGNYGRVLISVKGANYPDYFSTATERSIKNDKQINWNKATADWAVAKGFGLFSSATGGEPFYYGKLSSDVVVETGAVALFDPGTLKISISDIDLVE